MRLALLICLLTIKAFAQQKVFLKDNNFYYVDKYVKLSKDYLIVEITNDKGVQKRKISIVSIDSIYIDEYLPFVEAYDKFPDEYSRIFRLSPSFKRKLHDSLFSKGIHSSINVYREKSFVGVLVGHKVYLCEKYIGKLSSGDRISVEIVPEIISSCITVDKNNNNKLESCFDIARTSMYFFKWEIQMDILYETICLKQMDFDIGFLEFKSVKKFNSKQIEKIIYSNTDGFDKCH